MYESTTLFEEIRTTLATISANSYDQVALYTTQVKQGQYFIEEP